VSLTGNGQPFSDSLYETQKNSFKQTEQSASLLQMTQVFGFALNGNSQVAKLFSTSVHKQKHCEARQPVCSTYFLQELGKFQNAIQLHMREIQL
jgi:hypothetical protein